MSGNHTPWTKDGDDTGWQMPTKDGAAVCGAAPFYDAVGSLIGYTVNVGWNDKDSERRSLILEAVNSYASSQAEIERLRTALEPFAKAADNGEQMLRDGGYPLPSDDCPAGYEQRHGGYVQMTPLWGDLRKARAALSGSKE